MAVILCSIIPVYGGLCMTNFIFKFFGGLLEGG